MKRRHSKRLKVKKKLLRNTIPRAKEKISFVFCAKKKKYHQVANGRVMRGWSKNDGGKETFLGETKMQNYKW